MSSYMPYEPLNELKVVAPDVWIADGPEMKLIFGWLGMPFPTRMTVIRLAQDEIWIHSPIAPDPKIVAAVQELGSVRYLIAPNTLHYWWLPEWQSLFPSATCYALPGLEFRAKRSLPPFLPLMSFAPEAWRSAIDHVIFEGRFFSEAAFFHKTSRTLILTDLVENFELPRVKSRWLRWLIWFGGVFDPHGSTPAEMKFMFSSNAAAVCRSAEMLLNWNPARVLLAHGRYFDCEAAAELRRALGWALKSQSNSS